MVDRSFIIFWYNKVIEVAGGCSWVHTNFIIWNIIWVGDFVRARYRRFMILFGGQIGEIGLGLKRRDFRLLGIMRNGDFIILCFGFSIFFIVFKSGIVDRDFIQNIIRILVFWCLIFKSILVYKRFFHGNSSFIFIWNFRIFLHHKTLILTIFIEAKNIGYKIKKSFWFLLFFLHILTDGAFFLVMVLDNVLIFSKNLMKILKSSLYYTYIFLITPDQLLVQFLRYFSLSFSCVL